MSDLDVDTFYEDYYWEFEDEDDAWDELEDCFQTDGEKHVIMGEYWVFSQGGCMYGSISFS